MQQSPNSAWRRTLITTRLRFLLFFEKKPQILRRNSYTFAIDLAMLIEFKVANHRSIREEQTLSMVASNYSDDLPQNLIDVDLVGMPNTRLVKAVVLYGANASGKTSVISALRFFATFIRDSATNRRPDDPIAVKYHQSSSRFLRKPTRFEITLVLKGIRMLYGIELDFMRVRTEYLVAYPKGRPQVWFEREWDENDRQYKWSQPSQFFRQEPTLRESVRQNASFISTAAQLNHEQATVLWSWFANQMLFLDLANEPLNWQVALSQLETPTGKNRLIQALAAADFGVTDITKRASFNQMMQWVNASGVDFKKDPAKYAELISEAFDRQPKPGEEAEPVLIHRGLDGHTFTLDFDSDESAGTRRFFSLLGYWFRKLDTGGLLVIDEIETSMHPLLAQALLKAFFSAEQGTIPAQLIFTTHNPLLLDQTILRRDQIWFTEKETQGATRLYPLTDYQPRKDESLVRGYLAGRYGGVPFIPNGLKIR
jgi:hypothetical protein